MKFLLSLIALLCFIQGSLGLHMKIEAYKEECFFEDLVKDSRASLQFQVLSGGFRDISVSILDPNGNLVYQGERETESRYTFTASTNGIYRFCLSNKISTYTSKVVQFSIEVGKVGTPNHDEFAKPDQVGSLGPQLDDMAVHMQRVYDEHRYLRSRERTHRDTVESTNSRVMWWAMFEMIVIGVITGWQVYKVTSFFEGNTTMSI
eukprot:TRINITY_DN5356_c0_g1_i1.p1 TRINITY_DN5356_c0_g1~~TRINITY_DN5356_c0_g1_i1.p1  ORF type:complete len:205 (+),score=51.43 TRINITY_DN5356_c0_g1_i1:95-709(+)